MTAPFHASTATGTRTEIVCTKCGKTSTVPFTPTAGRPVFCRDCFSKPGVGGAGGGGFSRGPPRGPDSAGAISARALLPGKKRMMAQGRKTHFIFDAKAILSGIPGGMEEKDNRAFLEGLFARGARGSTEDAQVFLEEKVAAGSVTHEQAIDLGKLIDKYSFYR